MNGKNVKELRSQIRNIVKELLPEVLASEAIKAIDKAIALKIKDIEKQVKDTMSEINSRHKDTMGYLVRQVTAPAPDADKK